MSEIGRRGFGEDDEEFVLFSDYEVLERENEQLKAESYAVKSQLQSAVDGKTCLHLHFLASSSFKRSHLGQVFILSPLTTQYNHV